MEQTKARKDERTTHRASREKTSKSQAAQARVKKAPTKANLRQMAKDWDHVT
ncbi:MAG TPA: hypothetical protein VM425_15675 [Myxococcota bacterium]|nr:hypothetical protein [Myxococcota bacterium]